MRFIKRVGSFRLLALVAALAAGVLAVSLSSGSSHREAPGTMLDPAADDTDVYAFTADDAPGSLTVVEFAEKLRFNSSGTGAGAFAGT